MTPKRCIRIGYCIDSFRIGGTELNAVRTAEELDPERFELAVIFLRADGPLRVRYEKLGLRMIHFPIQNLYSGRTALEGIRLAILLRRWGADIAHTHDIYTNIFVTPWARLFSGARVIASRRWWYEAPRPGLVKLNRWSYFLAHRVLANSSGVARLLAHEEGIPREKIIEVPNFLGESAFKHVDDASRIVQRQAWGIPDGAFAIGTVARLAPVKNQSLLLRAAAYLDSRFHLVFIGDGPSRAELEELAQDLRIKSRVHFVGEVISSINLHQFFDASVLCSTSEGFPNSVIEAMAAARPVVATPVGGVPDVIEDHITGLLVPCDNPETFAEALRKLEGDPGLRMRLVEAGRAVVLERFHQEIIMEKLMELYETLANRRVASISCLRAKGAPKL
jgi:glycosyltransferase involved in cell wall biosynthesis